jgi:hypothetical protein
VNLQFHHCQIEQNVFLIWKSEPENVFSKLNEEFCKKELKAKIEKHLIQVYVQAKTRNF